MSSAPPPLPRVSPLADLGDPDLLRTDAYIHGRWLPSSMRFPVSDPATGCVLAEVANHGADAANEAIRAAHEALPDWRSRPAKERASLMRRWFELLIAHTEDLARLMTAEQGKPLAEARSEVVYGASFIEWFAEQARRVYGETVPSPDVHKRFWVIPQAVGVCAAITPWNFPIAMITRKVAPALAAGCTTVVKPAEQTPLCALALAELAHRAGLPAGVLNVITADATSSVTLGRALCASPSVRHLSFTGSTEVGRLLMAQCAPSLKRLSLELGGNAPFIVFDDAHLERAVEGAMLSKYRNSGQTCVCANRFIVQNGLYDSFVRQLAERAASLKLGHGFEADVQQGPLIDAAALDKVEQHVADAVQQGARVITGGHRVGTRFYAPTVLADVTPTMQCAREETFGPLAPVLRFHTEAQAMALANVGESGLAGYFFSRDISRVMRVAETLEVGMVGINTGLISSPEVPFGGIKQSGLGREGGHQGMDEYLDLKYLCLGL